MLVDTLSSNDNKDDLLGAAASVASLDFWSMTNLDNASKLGVEKHSCRSSRLKSYVKLY